MTMTFVSYFSDNYIGSYIIIQRSLTGLKLLQIKDTYQWQWKTHSELVIQYGEK